MFRLQNNTPEVYTNNSRDFQLFERLFDTIINGVRFDINTIPDILNSFTINERMLDLLCTKIGFFTRENIPNDVLRVILNSFPYAVKNKGSKTGILYAVCTILKMEGTFEVPEIIIDNTNYVVQVFTNEDIKNKKALKEYLKYIIPVGYTLVIEKYDKRKPTDDIRTNDNYRGLQTQMSSSSQVRGLDRILNGGNSFDFDNSIEDNNVGTFAISEILNADNYKQNDTYSDDKLNTNRNTIDEASNNTIYGENE